jgi:lipopolysaccharide export system protein LptA
MRLKVLFLLFSFAPAGFALKNDASRPIQIISDSLTVNQKSMTSVFDGNVIITQGSIQVHALSAQATQNKDGGKLIHLLGDPVTFSQLNDDGELTQGQGNQFDYNSKNNLAILSGNAKVKKGANLVMGDKITYNTQTQIYSANSMNSNGVTKSKSGRVTVILQPQTGKGANANSFKLQ